MANFSANKLIAGWILFLGTVAALVSYAYLQQQNDIAKPANRTVSISCSFTINDIPTQAHDIRAWVPVPLSNEHQQMHSLQVPGNIPYDIISESEYGNTFLVLDLTDIALPKTNTLDIMINFVVTRHAISQLHKQSSVKQISGDRMARHLASNRLIPINGKIAHEAKTVAGNLRNPLDQIRSIYDHIIDSLTYDKSGSGWGRGDAVYACTVRKGNCTDFHSLFIGEARSLNIPARFIMGLSLPQNKTEGIITGYHCWGQFYLANKGWIPVDASEAHKYPEKREMFFGGLDAHRIAFTIGRDIKLPNSNADRLNYIIYPHVEINGRPHENIKTVFHFKE